MNNLTKSLIVAGTLAGCVGFGNFFNYLISFERAENKIYTEHQIMENTPYSLVASITSDYLLQERAN